MVQTILIFTDYHDQKRETKNKIGLERVFEKCSMKNLKINEAHDMSKGHDIVATTEVSHHFRHFLSKFNEKNLPERGVFVSNDVHQ